MNILPNTDKINIPVEKFTEYALNPKKDPNKAEAFRLALGYKSSNADKLIQNIKNNINKFNCTEKEDLGHGKRYEVIMKLQGENGKTANVLTAWLDDKENGEIRLINAYVDRKRGVKND
ncbi:MAG: hypothetical protein FWG44_04475 [Oscillospiraceae bacterium]|nr:hypothetical protein [Oscillospiraceae bacterium]